MRADPAIPMIEADCPALCSGDGFTGGAVARSEPGSIANAGSPSMASTVLPLAGEDCANRSRGSSCGARSAHDDIGDPAAASRSLPALNGNVAPGDIGDVLATVLARLRCLARSEAGTHAAAPEPRGISLADASMLFDGVRECASALGRIQSTLNDEMNRRHSLEREIDDTQAALALALSELAGTRAGERHALHLAHHDELTSLPNRAYFFERLDEELDIRAGRREALAVLHLDLDGFQSFNERHGKAIGDEFLRIVGFRLSRAVRADDVVCRLGGDQFGLLLADVHGHAQLGGLAGKLADAIAAPMQIGKRSLRVHASIGIAVSPGHGVVSDLLMRNAGIAMRLARREQSNFAFFDSTACPQAAPECPV